MGGGFFVAEGRLLLTGCHGVTEEALARKAGASSHLLSHLNSS